jgi:hypothetical protein
MMEFRTRREHDANGIAIHITIHRSARQRTLVPRHRPTSVELRA